MSALDRLRSDPHRSQRDKLELLHGTWRAELERLDDEALYASLRAIREAINSKKLRTHVDALIGALRRDGSAPAAPLPKPPSAPVRTIEAAIDNRPDAHRNVDLATRPSATTPSAPTSASSGSCCGCSTSPAPVASSSA